MSDQLIFEVFGRTVSIEGWWGGWRAFYVEPTGAHRIAHDIRIPPTMTESEIPQFLTELYPPEARAEGAGVHRVW